MLSTENHIIINFNLLFINNLARVDTESPPLEGKKKKLSFLLVVSKANITLSLHLNTFTLTSSSYKPLINVKTSHFPLDT